MGSSLLFSCRSGSILTYHVAPTSLCCYHVEIFFVPHSMKMLGKNLCFQRGRPTFNATADHAVCRVRDLPEMAEVGSEIDWGVQQGEPPG